MAEDDFATLAAKACQTHEQEQADASAKQKRETDAKNAEIARQISRLNEIMPLLVDAKAGFEKSGVPVIITQDYDVASYAQRKPNILFQCVGPEKQTSFGGVAVPKSKGLFFVMADEERVEVRITKDDYAKWPSDAAVVAKMDLSDSDVREMLKEPMSEVLKSYFASASQVL
jgi:hypothetical protein